MVRFNFRKTKAEGAAATSSNDSESLGRQKTKDGNEAVKGFPLFLIAASITLAGFLMSITGSLVATVCELVSVPEEYEVLGQIC
jgi:hypothetical protein